MKLKAIVTVLIIFFGTSMSVATGKTIDDAQKKAIEQIVHNYIINNPTVLVEATRALEKQQQARLAERAQQAIQDNARQLFYAASPLAGNRRGNVNFVEFFDYQCIHCRRMATTVRQLTKADSDLRVIYKELPIFGAVSEYAAKAALAADKQNKFVAFHSALMKAKNLSEPRILEIAKSVGLNIKKLKKDMQAADIESELKANIELAKSIGIAGTPSFVISSNPVEKNKIFFIPGAAQKETLQSFIRKAR